jgi:hypothetical protein
VQRKRRRRFTKPGIPAAESRTLRRRYNRQGDLPTCIPRSPSVGQGSLVESWARYASLYPLLSRSFFHPCVMLR